LPAVEPGFQPGGKNLTMAQHVEILVTLKTFGGSFGRQGCAPYTAGKDARRYFGVRIENRSVPLPDSPNKKAAGLPAAV
jgi:hypothetical protein